MTPIYQAPFPWFGGKSRVGPLVWDRFGVVANYVEPFAGSLAVLLAAPRISPAETVNDLDGFISNFWRAVSSDPQAVAEWSDWPVSEPDLHARHVWLIERRAELTERLCGDPDFCDPKIAGWWLWGICSWIGSGWCSGNGPWRSVDGRLENVGSDAKRKRPHLGDLGQGINRKRPHLGDLGQGINRQRPHLGDLGQGPVYDWMHALAARLRRVRVCCGDWKRVCGPSPTTKLGLTAVFLDPPYSGDEREVGLYAVDSGTVAADVRAWALEHGQDPLVRVALCGYSGAGHEPLEAAGWTSVAWKAHGGYGSQGDKRGRENASREVVWFSPHCLSGKQGELF